MPGQVWYANASGGFYSNQELSMSLYYQAQPMMRYRQFCDRDEKFGQNMGGTLLFDKVMNLSADTSSDDGAVAENAPLPLADHKLVQSQITVTERGVTVPLTEKLERLAKFDPSDVLQRVLINSLAKKQNRAAFNEFINTCVAYQPQGDANNPTSNFEERAITAPANPAAVAGVATRNIQAFDVKEIVDALKSGDYIRTSDNTQPINAAPCPPFDASGDYMCVCSVGFSRALRDDPDWEKPHQYTTPENIWSGEIGRYNGVRFIEDNQELPNLLSTAAPYKGGALFFGADAVKEIVVLPEEIRKGIPMDLGRDRRMGWYGINGFKHIWQYDEDTPELENRCVYVASA